MLNQYFSSKITWILCIENKDWTYYDVAIENMIERTKSILTDFDFEKDKNHRNMELLNWDIDSGDVYHIKPKTTLTVEDLLNLIKEIGNKNILICVNSTEVQEITPYIKADKIPDRFQKLKITGWTILFWKKGTYYAVSTWFDPDKTEIQE